MLSAVARIERRLSESPPQSPTSRRERCIFLNVSEGETSFSEKVLRLERSLSLSSLGSAMDARYEQNDSEENHPDAASPVFGEPLEDVKEYQDGYLAPGLQQPSKPAGETAPRPEHDKNHASSIASIVKRFETPTATELVREEWDLRKPAAAAAAASSSIASIVERFEAQKSIGFISNPFAIEQDTASKSSPRIFDQFEAPRRPVEVSDSESKPPSASPNSVAPIVELNSSSRITHRTIVAPDSESVGTSTTAVLPDEDTVTSNVSPPRSSQGVSDPFCSVTARVADIAQQSPLTGKKTDSDAIEGVSSPVENDLRSAAAFSETKPLESAGGARGTPSIAHGIEQKNMSALTVVRPVDLLVRSSSDEESLMDEDGRQQTISDTNRSSSDEGGAERRNIEATSDAKASNRDLWEKEISTNPVQGRSDELFAGASMPELFDNAVATLDENLAELIDNAVVILDDNLKPEDTHQQDTDLDARTLGEPNETTSSATQDDAHSVGHHELPAHGKLEIVMGIADIEEYKNQEDASASEHIASTANACDVEQFGKSCASRVGKVSTSKNTDAVAPTIASDKSQGNQSDSAERDILKLEDEDNGSISGLEDEDRSRLPRDGERSHTHDERNEIHGLVGDGIEWKDISLHTLSPKAEEATEINRQCATDSHVVFDNDGIGNRLDTSCGENMAGAEGSETRVQGVYVPVTVPNTTIPLSESLKSRSISEKARSAKAKLSIPSNATQKSDSDRSETDAVATTESSSSLSRDEGLSDSIVGNSSSPPQTSRSNSKLSSNSMVGVAVAQTSPASPNVANLGAATAPSRKDRALPPPGSASRRVSARSAAGSPAQSPHMRAMQSPSMRRYSSHARRAPAPPLSLSDSVASAGSTSTPRHVRSQSFTQRPLSMRRSVGPRSERSPSVERNNMKLPRVANLASARDGASSPGRRLPRVATFSGTVPRLRSSMAATTPVRATRTGSSPAAPSTTPREKRSGDLFHTPPKRSMSFSQRRSTISPATVTRNGSGNMTEVRNTTEALAAGRRSTMSLSDGRGRPPSRARITIPKPFALRGAELHERSQKQAEETRRKAEEAERRGRVFVARPMPDFSNPMPKPQW